jgi:hypothetical protein
MLCSQDKTVNAISAGDQSKTVLLCLIHLKRVAMVSHSHFNPWPDLCTVQGCGTFKGQRLVNTD